MSSYPKFPLFKTLCFVPAAHVFMNWVLMAHLRFQKFGASFFFCQICISVSLQYSYFPEDRAESICRTVESIRQTRDWNKCCRTPLHVSVPSGPTHPSSSLCLSFLPHSNAMLQALELNGVYGQWLRGFQVAGSKNITRELARPVVEAIGWVVEDGGCTIRLGLGSGGGAGARLVAMEAGSLH